MFPRKQIENALGVAVNNFAVIKNSASRSVFSIETESGSYCVKTCKHGHNGVIDSERAGLYALGSTCTVQVPGINAWGENYLVLEWLNSTRSTFAQWQDFARQLVELHNKPYGRFGFEDNGYCGESVQINDWCDSGFEFFVTRRIQPQARWARDRGLLSAADSDALDSFCTRVEQLVPEMPAVLLHGDLWSGNVMFTEQSPWVIDPAAYYGWAESDVAMTCLFGGFPDSFYGCYFEACSLPEGFYDRVDVYNLYHLLNHLNLFGGSYYQQVASTLKKYS